MWDKVEDTKPSNYNRKSVKIRNFNEKGAQDEWIELHEFLPEFIELILDNKESKIDYSCYPIEEHASGYYYIVDSVSINNEYEFVFYKNPAVGLIKNNICEVGNDLKSSTYMFNYSDIFNKMLDFIRTIIVTREHDVSYRKCNKFNNLWCFVVEGECMACNERHEEVKQIGVDYKGYVYVVEDEKDICKIGFSTNLPEIRNKQLSVTYHKDFKLVGYFQSVDPAKDEKELHQLFAKYRLKGEWFKLSYDEIKSKSPYVFIDVSEEQSKCA